MARSNWINLFPENMQRKLINDHARELIEDVRIVAGFVDIEDHGFQIPGDFATNNAAWIAARDKAVALGLDHVRFPYNPFVEALVGQMDLPDFVAEDLTQTPSRPFVVSGFGEINTQLKLDDPTARYMFGHPSYGQTDNRAQNSFVKIHNMRLWGRGDPTINAPVIAISNTWGFEIHNLMVGGNPAGNMIDIWSFNRGGAQTGKIFQVRSLKHRQWEISPVGLALYDLARFNTNGYRYVIGLHGALDGGGKCNNIECVDIESYYGFFGIIDTVPFTVTATPDYTSKQFPDGGGVDYLKTEKLFAGFEGVRKIEESKHTATISYDLIDTVTSQTEFALTTIPGEYINTGVDVYKDKIFRVRDPNTLEWHSRRIVSSSAARGIVIDGTLPIPYTVQNTDHAEIAYADAKAWSEGMHPDVMPHLVRWATLVYSGYMSKSRVEEGTAVCFMSYAGPVFTIDGTRMWSDRSQGFPVYDTPLTKEFADTRSVVDYKGQQARGRRTANGHVAAPSIIYGRPDEYAAEWGNMFPMKNTAKDGLERGDIVRIPANFEDATVPLNYTNGAWTRHGVFWHSNILDARLDDDIGIVHSGHIKTAIFVPAGATINRNDELFSRTNDAVAPFHSYAAQFLAPGTVDPLLAHRKMGYSLVTYTNNTGADEVIRLLCDINFSTGD